MPKLTKPLITALNPTDREVVLWDDSLPGFGVRAKPSGAKTFIVQYRNQSGRSRRLSVGKLGKVTLDQARKQAVRLMGQVATGEDPAEERRRLLRSETVGQLADVYMKEHCAGRCKPRTIEAHNWLLKKFIRPKLGKRKLLDLRPADIARMHADLRSTPYNANRALGLLRAMLNCAERWEMIPRGSNPAAVIKPYPEKKRERYLSAEELTRLLETLDTAEEDGMIDIYEAAAVRLLIFTGCRLNEITTLEWANIDFAKSRIVLERHKTDKHGAKIVPLNDSALEVLKALPRIKDNPYVIVGREVGTHLVNLQKPWRRVRKAAGLDDVRLHDLRHSFASFAVGAGIPLAVIGGLLGHRSVQTTARYAHLADDPLKQASDIVGKLLIQPDRQAKPEAEAKH
ncbi:site-specific integrase [Nitratireductor sp. XY-223]|uniref:site-specific integrase n=1 Tax=Nitratireductor sp. XY-223 TaxID=2561926 RepID=UPI0010A9E359|nr:site-specific integrase [Nitratireductor sp. XY-223]